MVNLAEISYAAFLRKAATASSLFAYTLNMMSRLVRRSNSLMRLLGETN